MQSRPVPTASALNSLPSSMQSQGQSFLLAVLERFEQKKEDAKRALRDQVDIVIDDLFQQLVTELVRVLPTSILPDCAPPNVTNANLERPNVLFFAAASGANNGNTTNNTTDKQPNLAAASLGLNNSLHSNSPTATPFFSQNGGPQRAASVELPTTALANGFRPPQASSVSPSRSMKRDSPSKDLTSVACSNSKHSSPPASVKLEPVEEQDRIESPITRATSSPSSVIIASSSSMSSPMGASISAGVAGRLASTPSANHVATSLVSAHHDSPPSMARVQHMSVHTSHGAHHSTPTSECTLGVASASPQVTVAAAHQQQQQQHHHHHHHHSGLVNPAPAHQSHALHFDSVSSAIGPNESVHFTNDNQPVNLSTSASIPSQNAGPTQSMSTHTLMATTSGVPPPIIDDFDGDEEYSDSDCGCDCEQCVGVQICKVDPLDEEHEADLSRPLKKRLIKRPRTDDSDDQLNVVVSVENKHSPPLTSGKDPSDVSGMFGTADKAPSPPMNGDFQEDDEAEEECSATFKTISIKCSKNDCLSMFKSKVERNQHLVNAHNILPFTCLAPNCNKGFDNVRQYGDHVSSEHSDVVNWACPKCTKVCPDHRMLCRHIYFFHQEGRFKCRKAKCNFIASFRIDVRKHSQLHTEMYACQFGCGKSFSHTHHRKRHERIHLRLKPFKCKWPNCGYSSEARSTVIRHIRIRHFNLPLTLKQQNELNIVDNRDPRDYMEILSELMN